MMRREVLSWQVMLNAWHKAGVPDVQIINFEIGQHHANSPWLDLQDGRQHSGMSSPQTNTAYVVCKVFPTLSEEAKAAFQLYTYGVAEGIDWVHEVLWPFWETEGCHAGKYWHPNTKHLLPYVETSRSHSYMQVDYGPENWREVVAQATETWTAIAANWAVIRIPDYMDHKSIEYKEYYRHVDRRSEQREREEYERLKRKFEKRRR